MILKRHILLFILAAAICLALAISLLTMTLNVGKRRIAIRKRLFEAASDVPRVLQNPAQATRAMRRSIIDQDSADSAWWALLADSKGMVMAQTNEGQLQSVKSLKATHRREADAFQHMLRRSRSGGYVRFLWSKRGDEALAEYVGYVEERMCGRVPCILMIAAKDLR
tara:strand:+ start:141 stop:641 length:501 start_codon:yes stop_codon:yes gene_type:complete